MSDVEISQSWYHFEDILSPQRIKVIREIFIINTRQNYLDFVLGKNEFSLNENFSSKEESLLNIESFLFTDIIVRGRNFETELSFEDLEEENGTLRIILGDLENWPSVPQDSQYPLDFKNIKIEIKYTQIMKNDPCFFQEKPQKTIKEKISSFFSPKYEIPFKTRGNLQPEYHVKVPRGMYVKQGSFKLKFILIVDNHEFYKDVVVDDTLVTKYQNRRKNNVFFSSKNYNEMQECITLLNKKNIKYSLSLKGQYQVKYALQFLIFHVFMFAILILVLSSLLITIYPFFTYPSLNNMLIGGIPFINILGLFALFLPMIVVFMNFTKENYEIYRYKYIFLFTWISLCLLIIKIFIEIIYFFNLY